MREQRFDLGGKQERPRSACEVERLHAKTVAHEQQALPGAVPETNREHAVEARDDVDAPFFVSVDDGFGVGVIRLESMAARLELASQRLMVVNLAVEDDVHGAVLVGHRLVCTRRQVDNGKAPERQAYSAGAVDPQSLAVGPAVAHQLAHRDKRRAIDVRAVGTPQPACNPAHQAPPGPEATTSVSVFTTRRLWASRE
jgi:hypothetical protein